MVTTSKKQQKANLAAINKSRDNGREQQWQRANRTSMDQNIMDAGRQKSDGPKPLEKKKEN
ncbi:Uncharacterised protein [uncultured archaeon]|nr:Uncharacterised protein [uncultured archaeon]